MKPVRVRPLADRDIDLALAYLADGNPAAAAQFLRELEAAFARIASRPRIGSPKYSRLLRGVRFWRLRRFPYLVFYVAQPRFVDVLRVLHGARDIPALLRDEGISVGRR